MLEKSTLSLEKHEKFLENLSNSFNVTVSFKKNLLSFILMKIHFKYQSIQLIAGDGGPSAPTYSFKTHAPSPLRTLRPC